MLWVELQKSKLDWRVKHPGVGLERLYWKLTQRQVDELNRTTGGVARNDDFDNLYLLGIVAQKCEQMTWSGLYDHEEGRRVSGPFSEMTETGIRNMEHKSTDQSGSLTPLQMGELIRWFEMLAEAEQPSDVLPVPDFYRSTAAWIQLYACDVVNEDSDIKPWNMPESLARFYSDVWYAQRVAMLGTHQRRKLAALREAANGAP